MIDEPGIVTLVSRVDALVGVQSEEVVLPILDLLHSLQAFLVGNNLAHIFDDKLARLDVLQDSEALALLVSIEGLHLRVFGPLEPLIGAIFATGTISLRTFDMHAPEGSVSLPIISSSHLFTQSCPHPT